MVLIIVFVLIIGPMKKMLLIEISFPAWQQYLSWTPLCRQHPHRHRRPQRLQNCHSGDQTKNEYNYFPR